jgi:PPOX class probable F420-dependent enzyme
VASATTFDEAPSWARELLDEVRVAHLGVLDAGGRPRVLPVTFAVQGTCVWSAIDHKPKRRPGQELARVGWLRERPDSALTVDRYDDDWTRLAWVQLLGVTEVVGMDDQPDALGALEERYSQYRNRPPQGPLLRLTPNRVIYWTASEIQ